MIIKRERAIGQNTDEAIEYKAEVYRRIGHLVWTRHGGLGDYERFYVGPSATPRFLAWSKSNPGDAYREATFEEFAAHYDRFERVKISGVP